MASFEFYVDLALSSQLVLTGSGSS